ncbi:MAG: LysR family transcriptional regulator [Alphaproteobacteria bacterium]|nr:LysR family transcriptional regulator [Alphaproteobacteria bacterium]
MTENLNDLAAFAMIAKAGSFTKAAAALGVSPSALSQTMRGLEERLGLRLLNRTTRSVSTTEAGERLLATVAPRLEEINAAVLAMGNLRDKPAGTVRITCSEYAAETVLWPKLAPVLRRYPDIKLELYVDHSFTDIAAERFDAGVRLGESVEKDMVAIRIGPDGRLVAVASTSYFKGRPMPQSPQDLMKHACINLRLSTQGGIYAWEFERKGRPLRVRVEGQLVFNTMRPMVQAARAGFGIAYVSEDLVRNDIKSGRLIQVLDGWSPSFPGFHLYYPSRRQASPAFQIIANALRYHGPN